MAFHSSVFLSTTTTITTTIFLLFMSISTASGDVANLCQHSHYPELCKSSIKGSQGVPDATKTSINAAILQTQIAKSMANKLTESQGASGKANLKTCKEVYDDAISNLVTSMKKLQDNQIADLKINLSAAMSDYETCDDGFTENPGGASPLAKVNELLHELTSNCLALASELKG